MIRSHTKLSLLGRCAGCLSGRIASGSTRFWGLWRVGSAEQQSGAVATTYFDPLDVALPKLGLLILALAIASSLPLAPASAQPQSATSNTLPLDQSAITADVIESLREQAATSTELDEDTKQKIEALCVQALDALNQIAQAKTDAESFKRDTDDVQERVSRLRQELEEIQSREPSPPTNLALPELEQEVAKRELALAELKAAQTAAENEVANRTNRRREARTFLISASQQLSDMQAELETSAPEGEPALLTQARRANLQIQQMLIESQQPALQHELAKYDAEDAVDYARLQRDVQTERTRLASLELQSLQESLSTRRATDSAYAVQQARNQVAETPEVLQVYAEQNVSFAEAAHALSEPITEAQRRLERAQVRLEELQKQFSDTQKRVNDIGMTGAVGAMLRRQRGDLPDLRRLRENTEDRQRLIDDAQYALFDYDDIRAESMAAAERRMRLNAAPSSQEERAKLETAVAGLVKSRREYLDAVTRNYDTYLKTLFELDATEQLLIRVTKRYQSFIDQRVLWIRSNRMLFSSLEIDPSDWLFFDPAKWTELGKQLGDDVISDPLVYTLAGCVLVVLLWRRNRLHGELVELGEAASRSTFTQFAPTVRAAFLTFLLAVTWPGVVHFLAWRLNVAANGSQFAHAMSQALSAVSFVYFPLEFLRWTCRRNGLADSHFDWHGSSIAVLRANLPWAILFGLPIVFVTSLIYASDSEHGTDVIERICFIAGMVVVAWFTRRVLRPKTGILREYFAAHRGGWLERLTPMWYLGSVLAPLALAGMTLVGYYYTAQQLTRPLYATFVFVLIVQLSRAFLQRLLLVHRRSVSIQQARERRAAAASSREQASNGKSPLQTEQFIPPEELQLDVTANTEQTQRLISTGVIVAVLVGLWLIWVDVLPALRILDQWTLWSTTTAVSEPAGNALMPGEANPQPLPQADSPLATPRQSVEVLRNVTAADVGLALLIGIVTIVFARNIPGLMEMFVLERLPMDNSIRYAVTTVTSYVIVLLGIILAFNAISVSWSKVQWLATALTFGLAFGLQEIFANFVSGLILLFERPLRVGDIVTIDEVTGVVSRIRTRATTITNWDRKEYVIPNKEFITGRMLNWTLTDSTNRIVIEIGVAYGSDVGKAKELLMQICRDHPLLLEDPPTLVTFEGFGDNSLTIVVRTYLPNLDNRLAVIDDLYTTIDQAFRRAHIEIAFPQRDFHLRSVDTSLLQCWNREQDRIPT